MFTPPQDPENVKCFLQAFANEVNFFTQAKLFKNPTKLNDPDIEIVRNILASCGLPSDDSTITNLLIRFSQLIDKDLLELKLKEMNEALLEYLDICVDPNENYLENLKEFLDNEDAESQAANEAAAAAQKLADLLALLDGDKIKNSAPKLFCKHGTGGTSVFDNQYSEVTIHNQDLMSTSLLKEINDKFNADIDKFKPIVLKQYDGAEDPLAALGISMGTGGKDITKSNFGKFLKKINDDGPDSAANQDSGINLPSTSTAIKDLFMKIGDSLPMQQGDSSTVGVTEESGIIYLRVHFGNLKYFLLINPNEETKIFYPSEGGALELGGKSTYSILYDPISGEIIDPPSPNPKNIKDGTVDEPMVPFNAEAGDLANTFTEYFMNPGWHDKDTDQSFLSLLGSVKLPYAYAGTNIGIKLLAGLTAWNPKIWPDHAKYDDLQKIHTVLYNSKSKLKNKDAIWFIRSLWQSVVSGIITKLVSGTGEGAAPLFSQTFKDDLFDDIPLKDLEAANIFSDNRKLYRDNGLVSTPEIFEDFKSLRQNLQCYIEKGTNPDSYQVAKLTLLYQALFNTLLVQEFLYTFFTFYVNNSSYGLTTGQAKAALLIDIEKRFNDNIFKIDNFHLNYKDDLMMIYKYDKLQSGYPIKSLFRKDLNGHTFDFLNNSDVNYSTLSIMTEEEQLDEIIRFYVDKHINVIKDKLNKRFDLVELITKQALTSTGQVFPTKTTPLYTHTGNLNDWIHNPSKKYKFKYTDTPIFVLNEDEIEFGNHPSNHASIEKGDQDPHQMQIHNGLMVQTYFDIRQKLDVTEKLAVQQKEEVKGEKPVAEVKDVAHYLFHAWRFNYDDLSEGPTVAEYEANTNFTLSGDNVEPPGNYGKIDDMEPLGANNYSEDLFGDYKKYYLRTQGKISRQDFMAYHFWPGTGNGPTIPFNVKTIMNLNGPETYYEKASVGARLCLVMDDSDNTAKRILNNIREYILANNHYPELNNKDLEKQIKTIFNEKVFRYRLPYDSWKIVLPLYLHEWDALEHFKGEHKKALDNGTVVGYDWQAAMLSEMRLMHDAVYYKVLESENPVAGDTIHSQRWETANEKLKLDIQEVLPEQLFDKVLPLIIKGYFLKERPNLKEMFDPTIKEIIGQISLAKSVINKDWKSDLTLTNESKFAPGSGTGVAGPTPGAGGTFDDEFSMWPLVLAALPTVIAAAATYSDPAWKTPWFFPGPQTPLGYLAKILNPL